MHFLYKLTAILFGVGVTLHNLEEAAYLPGWLRANLKLPFEPNERIYWVLTSLVSLVIWIPIVGVCLLPEGGHSQVVLSGFALVMAVNALLPHLGLSLVKHSYSPGTATAVLFNLPLGALLIYEQLSSGTTSPAYFWRNSIMYALFLAGGTLGLVYGAHAMVAARKL